MVDAQLMMLDEAAAFPAAAVEAKLREVLIAAAESAVDFRAAPKPPGPVDWAAVDVHLDSLAVVCILCVIEQILGAKIDLPASVVQEGGYRSVDAAVKHLMLGIEREWRKHGRKSHGRRDTKEPGRA